MASVKIEGGKFKSAIQVKANFRHSVLDSRLTHEHSNKDINKAETVRNTSIYGLTYAEVCAKYDNRIAELDATTNTNYRKDRLTCVGMVINLPDGVPEALQDRWFNRAADILKQHYGEENLIEMCIHRDEIHDYTDAISGHLRTSQIHGQAFLVPEHNGSLNGKWFTGKQNLIELNNKIDVMSQSEFGVKFMTGKGKTKGKRRTEDLKIASEKLAAEKIAELNERLEALEALEMASKVERDKLYDQAEKALKTAQSVSYWDVTNDVYEIMRNRRVTLHRKDGSTESMSYYDVVQAELQRRAAVQQQRQADELQRQQRQRSEAERQHAEKAKRFGDVVRNGGTGAASGTSTSIPQYDNPFEL